MRHILILFAVAFGAPALLNAIILDTGAAAIPEQVGWVLMLLGAGGFALALRAGRRPAATSEVELRVPKWR
ncbi:MAG: hypothetical protein JWO83_1480 [Caulobacteraceae bacterium]|nr:hypothetical protein [Caulobacteraceae bacterium]